MSKSKEKMVLINATPAFWICNLVVGVGYTLVCLLLIALCIFLILVSVGAALMATPDVFEAAYAVVKIAFWICSAAFTWISWLIMRFMIWQIRLTINLFWMPESEMKRRMAIHDEWALRVQAAERDGKPIPPRPY